MALDLVVATLESVRIGRFRAPRAHPRFADSGPTEGWLVVFPRTSVWIQHAGDAPVRADPTRAMLYNRGQEYRRVAIDEDGDRCEWFSFTPDIVAEAHARFEPSALEARGRPFRVTHARVTARAYALQRRVFLHACAARESARGVRLDPLFVEESALALLAHVVASAQENGARPDAPARGATVRAHAALVDAVKNVVSTRLDEPLPLGRVARAVGRSPFHLVRVFRAIEGMGVHAYRTQLRLRASLERVAEGADLTATALDLGFSSHSHFTVAFARAFGSTPTAFRAAASSKNLKAALGALRRH